MKFTIEDLRHRIAQLEQAGAAELPESKDTPLFILATSWRSGSTLLQRILMTDPSVLIWGEPHGAAGIISRLTRTLIAPAPREFFIDTFEDAGSDLRKSWVANLYPPAENFKLGLRSLLESWLKQPALKRGHTRWGAKFVRLGSPEALFLHWLYPHAKFLVLMRHPVMAFRSTKRGVIEGSTYHLFPEQRIASADDFAQHWNSRSSSWIGSPGIPGCAILRFEDLSASHFDFRTLESFCGVRLEERQALQHTIGSNPKKIDPTPEEVESILSICGETMTAFGYKASSDVLPKHWQMPEEEP